MPDLVLKEIYGAHRKKNITKEIKYYKMTEREFLKHFITMTKIVKIQRVIKIFFLKILS